MLGFDHFWGPPRPPRPKGGRRVAKASWWAPIERAVTKPNHKVPGVSFWGSGRHSGPKRSFMTWF